MKKNLYSVTYDLRIGRTWLAGNNSNGWSSRNVLANGDARSAISRLEREEIGSDMGGAPVNKVRILKVELIAPDVLD